MCLVTLCVPEQWGGRNSHPFEGFFPFLTTEEWDGVFGKREVGRTAQAGCSSLPFPAVSSVIEPVLGLLTS